MNLINTFIYLLAKHFNIIPSTSRSFTGPFPAGLK